MARGSQPRGPAIASVTQRPIAEEPPCPPRLPPTARSMQRKSGVIDDITNRLQTASASMLTEYRGLTVTDLATCAPRSGPLDRLQGLQEHARPPGGRRCRLHRDGELLEGPVAIAFVRPEGDAVTAAKALKEFAKTNPNLIVKGGMLGPRVLTVRDVENLAEVPPRDVLLARLAGGFQAPLVKAAGLFQAFTRNFAYGLKALIDTLPAEPEPVTEVPDASTPSQKRRNLPAADSRGVGFRDSATAAQDAVESDHKHQDAPATEPTATEETTGEAN